jgi:tRNA A37 threonylcarbamoyladenosine dehydratase
MSSALERVELLLGTDALERLAQARVMVAGLGAVGAMAAESLARSGVGHLVLVDFDELRATNLNRHPFAAQSTLGQLKVHVAARFLRDIQPGLDLTPLPLFLDADTAARVLAEQPCDVLLDAIDSLHPKTELLLAARRAQVPFILTCLGAARRCEPARITSADLAASHTCPLGRLLRKRLAKHGGSAGIRCVFSTEKPTPPAAALPTADFYVRGRLRPPLGSLHCVTATAGLRAAHEILTFLLAEKNGCRPPEASAILPEL